MFSHVMETARYEARLSADNIKKSLDEKILNRVL
jgi:hypothetical protein